MDSHGVESRIWDSSIIRGFQWMRGPSRCEWTISSNTDEFASNSRKAIHLRMSQHQMLCSVKTQDKKWWVDNATYPLHCSILYANINMKIYSNVISCFPIGKFDTFYINYSSVFSPNKYLMQEKYFLLVFHSKNKNIIFLYILNILFSLALVCIFIFINYNSGIRLQQDPKCRWFWSDE